MISLVILLLLAVGVMTGVRRGVVLQAGHLLSLIISFIVALSFYEELATKFRLWVPYPSTLDDAGIDLTMFAIPSSARLDEVFYKAFWFVVLFFGTKIILSILLSMFDSVTNVPILKQVKGLLGGVFGFIEMYIFIFLLRSNPIDTGCDRGFEFSKLHYPAYPASCELADGSSWIDKINRLPRLGAFFEGRTAHAYDSRCDASFGTDIGLPRGQRGKSI